MAGTDELVIRVSEGLTPVPHARLILTRAAEALEIPAFMQRVANLPEITVETQPAAKRLLEEIRAKRRAAEQHHAAQKGPINAVRNLALQLEKDDTETFKQLETKVGAKLLAFDAEMERQRKAEQERLTRAALLQAQAEADAKAKALRDAAKAEEDAATKRQLNAQARALKNAPVFVPPVEVVAPTTKTSTTTRWSAEITDVLALVKAVADGRVPLAALEPERLIESHPWLNTQVTQQREEFAMPGVVAVQKTTLSGR